MIFRHQTKKIRMLKLSMRISFSLTTPCPTVIITSMLPPRGRYFVSRPCRLFLLCNSSGWAITAPRVRYHWLSMHTSQHYKTSFSSRFSKNLKNYVFLEKYKRASMSLLCNKGIAFTILSSGHFHHCNFNNFSITSFEKRYLINLQVFHLQHCMVQYYALQQH